MWEIRCTSDGQDRLVHHFRNVGCVFVVFCPEGIALFGRF